MRHPAARAALLEAAQRLSASGLTPGTSGNVSVRVEGGLLVTPTGMPYGILRVDDLVELSLEGDVVEGHRAPSSEWRIHRDLYRARADVHAIVHAHPTFCTVLAILRRDLPAVHYMLAVAGTSVVRCARYETFGTEALSRASLEALGAARACLLANHGMVAVGESLPEALKVAHEVETVAEQYWRALQVGTPVVLDDEEMQRVLEKFRSYGQPR